MADRYLRRKDPGHRLQTTALVYEAYLKLVDQTRVHFFGIAAQMMRRVLVDHAKSKHREKRSGGAHNISLDEVLDPTEERAADLVALDDALRRLTAIDERRCRVVELRYILSLDWWDTPGNRPTEFIFLKR